MKKYKKFFILLIIFLIVSATNNYDHLIFKYANKYGIDPILLKALIHTESSFNPHAISSVGAIGLCQIMPETGKILGYSRQELFNPEKNIEAASRFLAFLYRKASHYWKEPYRTQKVLQAYYAGPAYIAKPTIDLTHLTYVQKVLKYYSIYKKKSSYQYKPIVKVKKIRIKHEKKLLRERYIQTEYYVSNRKINPNKSGLFYDQEMLNEFEKIRQQSIEEFESVRKQAIEEFNNIKKEFYGEQESKNKIFHLKIKREHGKVIVIFNSKADEKAFLKLPLKEKLRYLKQ